MACFNATVLSVFVRFYKPTLLAFLRLLDSHQLAYFALSPSNREFQPSQIMALKQLIDCMDKDIENLWPEFHDNEHLDNLVDIIAYPLNKNEIIEDDLYAEEYEDYFFTEGSDTYLDLSTIYPKSIPQSSR